MARRRKRQSPIKVMLTSSWALLVFLAFFIFVVVFMIIPALNNPNLSTLSSAIKPYALIIIGGVVLIALVKLYKQVLAAYKAKKYPLNQDTESPFVRTTMSEFLQRPTSWSLKVIQDIEWKRFEDLSMGYYLEKGILAKATSLGIDGGIDIKLYQDDTGEATSLVQCKAWNNKPVGVKAIREFLGVLVHEKVPKGFFMTSGEFTDEAKAVAKTNKINLINGEMFLAMIMRLPEVSQNKLLALAVAGDYRTPTCSQCGVKMVKRKSKRGAFWGCVNYPTCRQRLAIKKSQ
jgi:restriction system protein